MENNNIPTTIVIFGATGDLSKKKLFSALLDLFAGGFLPEPFHIIGFARGEYSDESYREFVYEAISKKGHNHKEKITNSFLEKIHYHRGDLNNIDSYKSLLEHGDKINNSPMVCTNTLFYLAVPPSLYSLIFDKLSESKLAEACGKETGWTRVLVEKPFGTDLKTAQELDKKLGKLFKEEQIFRIDHYLAKNAIQNIIAFRFSNMLFENSWNRVYVERVHIKLFENKGIEGRGSFYSGIGALRDVGQNHMLQMLALIAMENPKTITSSSLQKSRENVLSLLHLYDKSEVEDNIIRGQYEGYKDLDGVSGDGCSIETYFLFKAFIGNRRWRGVPFFLESGKRLNEDKVEIDIYFKQIPNCICGDESEHKHKNILTITLQPEEKIDMKFWIKKPGFEFKLEPKNFSFTYKNELEEKLPDAYEKILYDCILGDHTLFVSTDEVESAWKFIMSILENWEHLPLYNYSEGSTGPNEKLKLLA